MESFVTAALLSRCVDQRDFKQFKQVMQENTRKGEMTSPLARFEAIRAVCEIIIMPTASPAKQALFKQYLAQFK